jgi:hypothetical protein
MNDHCRRSSSRVTGMAGVTVRFCAAIAVRCNAEVGA